MGAFMKKNIIILGAGISGLSLAWRLKQHSEEVSIKILERQNRTGGWIQTIDHQGFVFEKGPRACQTRGAGIATLQLIRSLGIEDQVILADDISRKRYLLFKGRLRQIPSSLRQMLTSPWIWPAIPGLCKNLWKAKESPVEESIDAFARRRFNAFIAQTLFDPMISGIYAGDSKMISLEAAFPSIARMEKEHGSVIWGLMNHKSQPLNDPFFRRVQKAGLFSFKNGMETLVRALTDRLKEEIYLNTAVKGIYPRQGQIEVITETQSMLCDEVYSTIPHYQLSEMQGPLQKLSSHFDPFVFAPIAVVNMAFKKSFDLQGFGYLVPSSENENILGMTWDSSTFPQQNRSTEETRLTVMIGGVNFINFEKLNASQFLEIAKAALSKHLKINDAPDATHVMYATKAIPQYNVGYCQAIEKIKQAAAELIPKLTLMGNCFSGVSMNDCIGNN